MPPLRNDIPDREGKLRHTMLEAITNVGREQAEGFMASPACFLIETKTKSDFAAKISKLYQEAASQSYKLWTRRTEMRCYTLRDMNPLRFDGESKFFQPDTLMKYDDHQDQLKGNLVTILVHPLVQVAGTDEAKDFDQMRVWAKGIVWLDGKKE
jgi:hypothetical protein